MKKDSRSYKDLTKYGKVWYDLMNYRGLALKSMPEDYEDVVSYLYKHQLLKRKSNFISERNIQIFNYKYDSDLSTREISELMGISYSRVYQILRRMKMMMGSTANLPVELLLEKGIRQCEKEGLIGVVRDTNGIKRIYKLEETVIRKK